MAANPVVNGTLSRVHVVADILLAGAGFVLLPFFFLLLALFFFLRPVFGRESHRELQKGFHTLGICTGQVLRSRDFSRSALPDFS